MKFNIFLSVFFLTLLLDQEHNILPPERRVISKISPIMTIVSSLTDCQHARNSTMISLKSYFT